MKSLPKKLKALYVSALQSELFNQCLAQRMPALDALRDGDVAFLHRNGAAFAYLRQFNPQQLAQTVVLTNQLLDLFNTHDSKPPV